MRKLKVLVNAIPAANPVTGIGRYVLQLYEAIQEVGGSEVRVQYFDGRTAANKPPRGPRDLRRFTHLGRAYWKLPVALALPIRLAVHMRRETLFKRVSEGADVYHETAFFPFRPASGVRVVQTVHDLSLQFHPEWHPQERVAYARRYFEPRLEWSSEILCVSQFTLSELARFHAGAGKRARVTPLGVDRRFQPQATERHEALRARYGLPDRYLLFVGSGDPRKNSRLLGELVARGNLPCEVVCVGWEGWASDAAGPRVRMLGYLPDEELPGLYSGALAFVFPSLYEGFGLPVLEAMACGCPVVVPRAHSMPELVGDAGAFYGDPADADGLERTICEIAGNAALRGRLAEGGLRRARCFDWRSTARLTLDALERAATASGAPGAEGASRTGTSI